MAGWQKHGGRGAGKGGAAVLPGHCCLHLLPGLGPPSPKPTTLGFSLQLRYIVLIDLIIDHWCWIPSRPSPLPRSEGWD